MATLPFNLVAPMVVLVEPEITPNTGNIARSCAVTGAGLLLVGPLGFRLDDRRLRRAGLDYWDKVLVGRYRTYDEYLAAFPFPTTPRLLFSAQARASRVASTTMAPNSFEGTAPDSG